MIKKLVTAPAFEPVSLADAKSQCRVDIADDDALISGLVTAARQYVESETGLALITQTWDVFADEFRHSMRLLPSPVGAVVSVSYVDMTGVIQVVPPAKYRLDSVSEPARLTPEYLRLWPIALHVINAVTIRVVSGFASSNDVPAGIKQAMLLLISHWYENREGASPTNLTEIPHGVDRLLAQHRVVRL